MQETHGRIVRTGSPDNGKQFLVVELDAYDAHLLEWHSKKVTVRRIK